MNTLSTRELSERYADLSDRFRSLWTFYQFLGGIFKHLGEGALPYSYDFQTLYRQIQELAPRPEMEPTPQATRDLQRIERELTRIRERLADIENAFPPSQLRRFFDHLKRQDEKILFALVKFYLLAENIDQDNFDKLDILLTRLAEAPLEDGRVLQRDSIDLKSTFERLAVFARIPRIPLSEEKPLTEAVRETRQQIQEVPDFQTLLDSQVLDRYRRLKQRLAMAFLHPPILLEIIACNIEAKNRFKQLYEAEEARILEDTNRILEIERYLDRNPNLAHEELRAQIDVFRRSRARFDSGRKDGNVKREDIFDLRNAMEIIFDTFDNDEDDEPAQAPAPAPAPELPDAPEPEIIRTPSDVFEPQPVALPQTPPPNADKSSENTEVLQPVPTQIIEEIREVDEVNKANDAGAADLILKMFPPDPLIDTELKKIIFGLELVIWVHSSEQAVHANELRNLNLEPWEVDAYRKLAEGTFTTNSTEWNLQRFFLQAASLRVRIEEEVLEIARLNQTERSDLLVEKLEQTMQTLDRSRDIDRRFRWFIDDLMFRGETQGLERLHRSYFRFLRAYSALWLDHQAAGGLTPL